MKLIKNELVMTKQQYEIYQTLLIILFMIFLSIGTSLIDVFCNWLGI